MQKISASIDSNTYGFFLHECRTAKHAKKRQTGRQAITRTANEMAYLRSRELKFVEIVHQIFTTFREIRFATSQKRLRSFFHVCAADAEDGDHAVQVPRRVWIVFRQDLLEVTCRPAHRSRTRLSPLHTGGGSQRYRLQAPTTTSGLAHRKN